MLSKHEKKSEVFAQSGKADEPGKFGESDECSESGKPSECGKPSESGKSGKPGKPSKSSKPGKSIFCLTTALFFVAYAIFQIVWLLAGLQKSVHYFPDELARLQVVDFIFSNGALPTGLEPEVRISLWGSSYGVQPTQLAAIAAALFKRIATIFTSDATVLLAAARLVSTVSIFIAVVFVHKAAKLVFLRDWLPVDVTKPTASVSLIKNTTKPSKISQSIKTMTANKRIAHKINVALVWLMTVTFAFLPQVLHISSYFNNDALSLAGAAIVFYGLVRAWQNDRNNLTAWSLSGVICVAVGSVIILLAYYNAYGWLLVALALVIFMLIRHRREPRYCHRLLKLFVLALAIIIVGAGGFFVRNALLHNGDIIGMSTAAKMVEQYAEEPVRALNNSVPMVRGSSLLGMLRDGNWVPSTLKSFVAGFSGMSVFLPGPMYLIYYGGALVGVIGFGTYIGKRLFGHKLGHKKTRQIMQQKEVSDGNNSVLKHDDAFFSTESIKRNDKHNPVCQADWLNKDAIKQSNTALACDVAFYCCMLAAICLPIMLSVYYSYTSDYQAQGRYIITCLPALALILCMGYKCLLQSIAKNSARLLLAFIVCISISICYAVLSIGIYLFVFLPS
ncbi:MAG: glycosyltransferase family 39 protein [Coriobacteriales bacterium]|nr:glycosyltransferase family 39 protein [Coriobacteriales bacterium]